MRNVIAIIALLLLTVAGAAWAGTGLPMLNYGLLPRADANLKLIELNKASLKKDADGNAPLASSVCTTPRMYWQALHDEHREIDLPSIEHGGFDRMFDYISTWQLVKVDAAMAGHYRMSRVLRHAKGCTEDSTWSEGELRIGEFVYVDRNSHQPVARVDCGNIIGERIQPHAEIVPARPSQCFSYSVDGRGYPLPLEQPLVPGGPLQLPSLRMPLELEVSFYNYDDGSSLHKLMDDPCLYAEDGATHERLRLDLECDPCKDSAVHQAIWPDDVSDEAKAKGTKYHFVVYNANGTRAGFPSGYGTVHVPYWFLASSIWCFATVAVNGDYFGPAPPWYSSGPWDYSGYYDLVTVPELRPDLEAHLKKFHRGIKPVGVFGRGW
jgi:hypothetical protein